MEKYNYIIGIDPGAGGGIACCADGRVTVSSMPADLRRLEGFITNYCKVEKTIVFIEKLSIRQDDLAGGKIFRVKKMIANYEALKTVLSLCGVDFCEVHPLTWQSRLGIRGKGETYTERKSRFKDVASAMFPQVKVTLKTCDALLIMHYGITMINSISKKDVKWIKDNIHLNRNDDVYNYIF